MSNYSCILGSHPDKVSVATDEELQDWVTYVPERTCHVEGSYYDELMDESYTDLSCGHHLRGDEREFDFCSKCGARVLLCYNS